MGLGSLTTFIESGNAHQLPCCGTNQQACVCASTPGLGARCTQAKLFGPMPLCPYSGEHVLAAPCEVLRRRWVCARTQFAGCYWLVYASGTVRTQAFYETTNIFIGRVMFFEHDEARWKFARGDKLRIIKGGVETREKKHQNFFTRLDRHGLAVAEVCHFWSGSVGWARQW